MIFPVVLLSVTFLGLFSASQGSDEACYSIVKPLLRYFETVNEKDSQILQLQKDYAELQRRHWDVQDKFEQLQSRIQDVESLKAQIQLLEEQIRALNRTSELAVVKNGEMLANQLREEIEKLRSLGRSGERSNPEATAQAKVSSLPDHCPGSQDKKKVIQEIQIGGADPFKVVCYSDEDKGSGWMIVLNKVYGSNKFNRTFEEYVSGFGDVGTADEDEFFIGLQRLHLLTNGEPYEVHLEYIYSTSRDTERCDNFVIGNRSEGFMVKSTGYCKGSLWYVLKQDIKFSTFDRDEDSNPYINFATDAGFGWWHDAYYIQAFWNSALKMMIRRKA